MWVVALDGVVALQEKALEGLQVSKCTNRVLGFRLFQLSYHMSNLVEIGMPQIISYIYD